MKLKQQSDQVDFQNDTLSCASGDVLIGSDHSSSFWKTISETSQISKQVDRKATRTSDILNPHLRIIVDKSILMVVQTQVLLCLKSMSERVGSEIERLLNWMMNFIIQIQRRSMSDPPLSDISKIKWLGSVLPLKFLLWNPVGQNKTWPWNFISIGPKLWRDWSEWNVLGLWAEFHSVRGSTDTPYDQAFPDGPGRWRSEIHAHEMIST